MNVDSVRDLFLELVQIDSPSLQEKQMAVRCRALLEELGFDVEEDDTGTQLGGEQGNLIATLPGDPERTTILLAAHMDTVQPGVGVKPVVDPSGMIRSSGDTVLGADDKAGIVAIISALQELRRRNLNHGPIQVVFTVAEEMGLQGSKHLDAAKLTASVGLSLDSGDAPGTLIIAGPSQVKWQAQFVGRSSHAGVAPEQGISAIKVAAQAVAKMPHGRVDSETTVNVGSFMGEGPTNVVRDKVHLLGEARSLDEAKLAAILKEIDETFNSVADAAGASVTFDHRLMYKGFRFNSEDGVRKLAEQAIEAEGLTIRPVARGGGSDANNFTALGVPTINIGIGYMDIHSTSERISVDDIIKASRIALRFIELA